MTTPSPAEFLARPNVISYIGKVLASGGRVILSPTWPYFGVILSWRMGPTICVRCGKRPVRMPRGRYGCRASTCAICGHRSRDRAAGSARRRGRGAGLEWR